MLHVTPPHERIAVSDTGCWIWTGANNGRYGVKYDRGAKRQVRVHRVNYEHFVGPIPDGCEIDHLCKVKLCCNPEHLEAVTHQENTRRERQAHCKNGHPLDGDNLRITPTGVRRCRTCTREYKRARYRRRIIDIIDATSGARVDMPPFDMPPADARVWRSQR